MGDDWRQDATRRAKAALIDTSVPNAARVGDYMYGGQNNFEVDRKAARALVTAAPIVATIAPAGRAFQRRVMEYLVAEAGIRQFLDIGAGLPLVGNTHEIAQSRVPQSRIVYVDNDPMVLAHARALMKSTAEGAIGYVDADIRDTEEILADAGSTLDLRQPVAIMLLFTLAYVGDAAATAVVSSLMASLPSGSHVAIYHLASDLDPTLKEAVTQWNTLLPTQRIKLRSRSQVADLGAGLELIPPGLVPISEWRPAPTDPRFEDVVPIHGLVARKP